MEHLILEILLHQEIKREQLTNMGKYEKCMKLELLVVNVLFSLEVPNNKAADD